MSDQASTSHGSHHDESHAERLDRNLGELLQELRVAQNGVQILFAFLLTLPFQQRFQTLTAWERHLYVVTLVLSSLAVTLLIAPVSFHRVVFRFGMKDQLVTAADHFMQSGLLALAASMSCALLLVLHVVVDSRVAYLVAGLSLFWLVTAWYAFPLGARARARGRGATQQL